MRLLDRREVVFGAGALAGLAPLSAGAYGVAAEPFFTPRVTRYALLPPRWPPELALKIGVVADIHACEPFMTAERLRSIAESVNALEPDLIVLLGDFNAGHRFVTAAVPPGAWAEALAVLRAPLGVYAILGNHDWWHGPVPGMTGGAEEVRRALRSIAVTVLENNAVSLEAAGGKFWLAGLADQMAHVVAPHRTRGADDLGGTLRDVGDEAPVLMLAHEPFVFPRMPERVSLTLCGHTHGGQINLPLIGRPIVVSRHYIYGHMIEQGRHLIISGGLGESGIPVRIGVPPEILEVRLGADAG
jgi:predicted MPP superfamily phosphohydrolase